VDRRNEVSKKMNAAAGFVYVSDFDETYELWAYYCDAL
jgi:hypothetical protein